MGNRHQPGGKSGVYRPATKDPIILDGGNGDETGWSTGAITPGSILEEKEVHGMKEEKRNTRGNNRPLDRR